MRHDRNGMRNLALRPGRPFPLGAEVVESGVSFAVFSAHAERIELCLFDSEGVVETRRLSLPERTDQVFHGLVEGLGPGQVYGLRAYGPWTPELGHRFNPHKLLLDPYAKALQGRFRWTGPNLVDPDDPFAFDPRDSAPFVPKAVVLPPLPAVPNAERPDTPWDRTVIYEAHVKGLTKQHPALPAAERGTYLGLAHPRVIEHLVGLGITAVELLPVAAFLDELRLVRLGLANHWGYNSYAFMAPEPRYASRDPLAEFRIMVQALHAAGIEVILDVVFNHTAESDELGPTLAFRGLDNASYYRLEPHDKRLYVNHAGCGNVLNLAHPRVLQMVMDSLRYWAALGVDGFRFDLATILGRAADGGFDSGAPFLQALAQDPALGRLKLIAEPWDIGPYGYQLGRFPPPFAEWNDRFRDCVRRFWRGDEAILPELAGRLLGSAELFEPTGRKPQAGVNYVTSHDGFTLKDLTTFARKHNEANGEGNRDGHHVNFSANWGAEGPSDDPEVRSLRERHRLNLMATLLLAQGTPMLLMGDEIGRTQNGNNNAYCQDNPLSWCRWDAPASEDERFLAFVKRLTRLRRRYPVLRRRHFLHGRAQSPAGVPDVVWLGRDGQECRCELWHDPQNRAFGLMLCGAAGPDPDAGDGPEAEATLLLLANAHDHAIRFVLPKGAWRPLLDTAELGPEAAAPPPATGSMTLAAYSLVLLEGAPDLG
jgi:glycogen operon protein